MSRFKIPPQFTRLILLTVLIVAAYLLARSALTPRSFGQYGWYRGDALQELAQLPTVYAGRAACTECHKEAVQKVALKEHKTLGCETCHGVSLAHVQNPDVKLPKLTDNHCLRCHEREPARPLKHKQIESQSHYKGDRCIECHVPHQPSEVP